MTKIPGPFDSVENQRESIVFELVASLAASSAALQANPALLADIACIALNSLKPRYICRPKMLSKHITEQERETSQIEAHHAVQSAFEFVVLHSATEDPTMANFRDL
jgi:Late competence development protein ComFB